MRGMGATKLCPYCRLDMDRGATRCPHCGGELRYCPHCKRDVPLVAKQKFVGLVRGGTLTKQACRVCGKVLEP